MIRVDKLSMAAPLTGKRPALGVQTIDDLANLHNPSVSPSLRASMLKRLWKT